MFPLSEKQLPLLEIADFWSREIEIRTSFSQALARLESAWWQGELKGNLDRLQFLRKMFESRRRDYMEAVVFATPSDKGQPAEIPLGDGGIRVLPKIIVPDESDDWTELSCADAFATLARLPSQQYFPLLSYSICFIDFTSEEFFAWVNKRRFREPKFWRRDADIDVTDATCDDRSTYVAAGANSSGRGGKNRAIQQAYRSQFPNGEIPIGMTSQRRNELIRDVLKANGSESLPVDRTIQRAIKNLHKS
jgi:hypothetical protein